MSMLRELFKLYFYMILIFFIGRLSLFIIYFNRFKDINENYYLSFLHGLRMDTVIVSVLLIIPMFLLTLSPNIIKKQIDKIIQIYFLIILSITIFIENASFPFIAEYDVRPNYLFVEYLKYPKEVVPMLIADHLIALLVSFFMILTVIFIYLKKEKNSFIKAFDSSYLTRLSLFIPLVIVFFIGARSSFGHRPLNISDAMFTNNRIVNEITKNSIYSIGYAIYSNQKYGSSIKKYGKMDIKEAINRVEKRLQIKSINDSSPFLRTVKTNFPQTKPKNLVLFIQESLGGQFVEAVGGEKGITPNINRLAKDGILFRDAYSNGTRSIRGLAGLVSGILSVPGKGVLKRDKSQKNFFTIASLLKPYGYQSSFFYGGESRFDNMKGWFIGNGFDKIIDQEKFKNPKFVGTWGISDDEVVDRANKEFKELYNNNQKFASVIFSTTNHTPFEFPDGKIELIKGEKKNSVKNTIKFADYAIGKLIKSAKKDGYYKDTIFVIVADHNVRVYGDDVVPVNMFHIPALILGGGVKPKIYDNIVSQPDILATALDLMGIDNLNYPILGKSIFDNKKQNISLMQFHSFYALRVENKVAVIRPDKKPLTFIYKNNRLVATKPDIELQKDALAFIISLNYLYDKRLYQQQFLSQIKL